MNKFLNKKPINFWEFYNNEGATQLVFPFDHFINRLISFLWSKFYYQYSSDDVFSQGHFKMTKIFIKGTYKFV